MAAVNISTGKIIGCKKNSLKWFHEVGHLTYNNSSLGIRSGIWQKNIFYFMIAFILVSLLFKSFVKLLFAISAIILFIIYLGFEIFEELWCWYYAFKKYRGLK